MENQTENNKNELTLDEKIRLVTGVGSWHTYDANGKVKPCVLHDGPHGLRKQEEGASNNNSLRATCFPTACAVAAGWDKKLPDKMARAIAKEAIAEGVAVVLGPGTNIKRSPLCGRNFEYYSEDPLLAGSMATAFVKAMEEEGVGTSLKHFAANNQETYRMTGNSRVDERTLREIYLTAFEMAVKEGKPATVMASYNQINGVYSCENKWLLTDVLSDEWGFDGIVISDWGACGRLSESIEAGMDLEMPDTYGVHGKLLKKDLLEGDNVTLSSFYRAVNGIINLSEKYSREPLNLSKEEKQDILDKNHEIAVEIETECAVLLKNNGILPLNDAKDVVVIGSMAENVRFQGGGSSHINTDNVKTAIEALKSEGVNCSYFKGYDDKVNSIDNMLEEEAVKAAKNAADNNLPVLFFGGLTDTSEGEGYDRKSFSMPDNQVSLLEKVCQVNPKTIFVAFGGSPFDLTPADKAAAILLMYLGGEGVMEAAAKLLTGKCNPSGKLPETFPLCMEDTPCFGNFATKSRNADYKEGLFVGYRFYDSFNKKVRFPFGYGLSYTDFKYDDLVVKKSDDLVEISLKVTNVGTVAGKEIVEIFVSNPKIDRISRASRELRAFEKIEIMPGKTQEVRMTLPERAFSIYDIKAGEYRVVPGEYIIQAASSIDDVRLEAKIEIEAKATEADGEKSGNNSSLPYGPKLDFDKWVAKQIDRNIVGPGSYTVQNSLTQLSEHSLMAKGALKFAQFTIYRMFKDKPKDDPEVMMFYESACEGTLDGVVNGAGGKFPYRIAESIVLAANGHKIKAFIKLITG